MNRSHGPKWSEGRGFNVVDFEIAAIATTSCVNFTKYGLRFPPKQIPRVLCIVAREIFIEDN